MADDDSLRAAHVELPDEMVKDIAEQLGIKNLDRIPRTLTVAAIPDDTDEIARGSQLRAMATVNP